MGYRGDDSEWPLCRDLMTGAATDEELEQYNQTRVARLLRGPHVQLIDARTAHTTTPKQRSIAAEFNRDHFNRMRENLIAMAFVSTSVTVRGYLTAIFWLSPPAYPYRTFSDVGSATVWLRERLAERMSNSAPG